MYLQSRIIGLTFKKVSLWSDSNTRRAAKNTKYLIALTGNKADGVF